MVSKNGLGFINSEKLSGAKLVLLGAKSSLDFV